MAMRFFSKTLLTIAHSASPSTHLVAVDALAAGAVAVSEVASLDHCSRAKKQTRALVLSAERYFAQC